MITDSSIASPALLIKIGSATYVLAACLTSPSPQMHYFIDEVSSSLLYPLFPSLKHFANSPFSFSLPLLSLLQNPDNLHSRAYTALFINWLAPAGIFQGARRIFVNAQVRERDKEESVKRRRGEGRQGEWREDEGRGGEGRGSGEGVTESNAG